jgi:CBS domain-containing protein
MKAADVMVSNVVTVDTTASIADVATILIRNRISGVPVIDEKGSLAGIVSEGDLLRRPEADTYVRRSWWLELLTPTETLAADFVKTHSRKVTDVMTRDVITAAPDTPLSDIAGLLERHHIKRVPIVDKGKVVGIVSRANLLQALATLKGKAAITEDDKTIRDRVEAQLEAKPWARRSMVNVIVHDGTVELWGIVESQEEKRAVRVLAEVTPGVTVVNDNLAVQRIMSGV